MGCLNLSGRIVDFLFNFTSVHFDNDNQAMQLSIESFEMTEETDTV